MAVDEDFLNGQCNYHASFDAGDSWSSGSLAAPAGFPAAPCVQFDTGGWSHSNGSIAFGSKQNVYTAFSSFKPGDADSILLAKSDDGGRTFGPARVAVAGLPGGRSINIRPNVAALARSTGDRLVIVYWGCETPGACSGTHRAMSVASDDGGQTWHPPVLLSQPTDGPANYPSLPTVGPDGTFYVTFRRAPAAARSTLVLATTKDGSSWSYEDIPSVDVFNEQKLVADPHDGSLNLAYHAAMDGPDQDIVFQRRAAGATTWSKPVRVNDDPAGRGVLQRFPWLTVGPDGRIYVLWQDRRQSYPGNNLDDYYWASSADRGKTFSANRRVTDRSINLDVGLSNRIGTASFYWPAMAVTTGGAVVATWPDSREGNVDTDSQDIYRARIAVPAHGPVPVSVLSTGQAGGLDTALSRLAYPGGREPAAGGAYETTPVVVDQADPAAAEVAAVLARARLGPVLLAGRNGLDADTQAEVRRLQATSAFLLGTRLSARVAGDLRAAGVPAAGITRISGSTPAELASLVAARLDTRSDADRSTGAPAFSAVVIANPSSAGSAAAAGMAAALRLPFLFVGRDAVPAITAQALRSLNITQTIIIGGPDVISAKVQAALPSPKRLDGTSPAAMAAAIAAESRRRGLPTNVVYVADSSQPVQTATAGAAVARLGGALVAVPQANPATAEHVVAVGGLQTSVDRLVVIRVPDARSPTVTANRAQPQARLPATGGGFHGAAVALVAAGLLLTLLSRRALVAQNT